MLHLYGTNMGNMQVHTQEIISSKFNVNLERKLCFSMLLPYYININELILKRYLHTIHSVLEIYLEHI